MAASGLPGFRDLPLLIAEHACARPEAIALRCGEQTLSYAQLDSRMDQVAVALQRDGLQATQCIAICASASIDYLAVFSGAFRTGVAVAPLAPGSTAWQGGRMVTVRCNREVVLCAGAIQSPQLLELSEGGPGCAAAALWGVGAARSAGGRREPSRPPAHAHELRGARPKQVGARRLPRRLGWHLCSAPTYARPCAHRQPRRGAGTADGGQLYCPRRRPLQHRGSLAHGSNGDGPMRPP